MTIWKFTLSHLTTSVEMPAGARLLSAGVQDHDIVEALGLLTPEGRS